MQMNDLESEDYIASYEETSSEDTEDVKVCDVCGNVGDERKLAVCSRCNDGAVHIYCMLVMLQEVPESGWLCDECQAEVEIEAEKKKLEKSQVNFVMVSRENKADAKKAKDASNVAHWNKRLNRQSEANFSEEIKDVKVCDICGDVGEVEKLTVCGRCNGAEHVYCMQVLMEKVPEVMWLCEACQTEVEFAEERMELEKSQVMVGACKLGSFGGQTNKPVDDANRGSYFEDEMEAEHVSSKNSNMRNQSNGMATKRIEDDATITLLIGKDLPESGGVSVEGDSAKRVPLPRKKSLKLDTEKGKEPARPMPTSLTLNAVKNQAPPLCGQLPKSISFNNKKIPKVKQLAIEVPQKPNNLKEPLSLVAKQDGPVNTLAKSTSVKKPNSREPVSKVKSSILLDVEEPRMMNSVMSRNVTNKSGTSISGYPSVAASMFVPVLSKAESAAQHLNQRNKRDNLGIAYGQDGRNFPAPSEPKRQLVAKVPGSLTLISAERSSGMLCSGAQMKGIQIPDTSLVDKIKNPPSLKPGTSSSSCTMHCQQCDEVGHSTQFCPVDRFSLFVTKPLSEETSDRTARSNRTSQATTLTATEDILESAYQSEPIPKRRRYHNPLYRPINVVCTSISHEGSSEEDVRNAMPTPSITASVDCPELKYKEHQAASAMGGRFVDSGSTMLNDPTDKSPSFSPSDDRITSSVPELAYIWQGCFALWKTGRPPKFCKGLQGHLSCSASQKVLEIAKKFPSEIRLEQLPRRNICPPPFDGDGLSYGSIDLFFFATDIQSYERHYSKLVERMLTGDLALRGNIETAELLIFPSNILPKSFRRWNMSYYLWGVFRVRRKDPNLSYHAPTRKHSNFNGNLLAVGRRTHAHASSGPSFYYSPTCEDSPSIMPLEANHEGCANVENSLGKESTLIDIMRTSTQSNHTLTLLGPDWYTCTA
ncbi:uncharacterized protein LOC123399987 isoform X2 [Hordeum vulgare subsp. vulgare]|uniref:uncharacterized protein LOC123399987 isoform X2 n=1 Tax=Hordeum vulgare subsp. vulgare TaxID=112509 RepID=UPI001D1A519F|nr:uncharacterized protein LOC123399987 isoform X2 [Hordeum vulgare subsp. vulgare]